MKTIDHKIAFGLACDLLRQGQQVKMRVTGQSMLPFFRSGDIVRLRPITPGDIAKGHVVLGGTEAGNFVIHRIIRFDERSVTLLGDGNYLGTEQIARDKIYGIVNCSHLHLFCAHIWLWLRPVRRYPLWLLRKISRP